MKKKHFTITFEEDSVKNFNLIIKTTDKKSHIHPPTFFSTKQNGLGTFSSGNKFFKRGSRSSLIL